MTSIYPRVELRTARLADMADVRKRTCCAGCDERVTPKQPLCLVFVKPRGELGYDPPMCFHTACHAELCDDKAVALWREMAKDSSDD